MRAPLARASQVSTAGIAGGRGRQLAQDVEASLREAQLDGHVRHVAIDGDLEVRALADDASVLEEVDAGFDRGAAVAVLVRGGHEGGQGVTRRAIDPERGGCLQRGRSLDVAEGLAVLDEAPHDERFRRDRRRQAGRPKVDTAVRGHPAPCPDRRMS